MPINCSVTVMLVHEGKIGFIRREKGDTYGDMLVAPGGMVEESDGEPMEGVNYYSVESCAIREIMEETGIAVERSDLRYFCSLTLPGSGRVVISLYATIKGTTDSVVMLSKDEIASGNGFAPGMKSEALLLAEQLKL